MATFASCPQTSAQQTESNEQIGSLRPPGRCKLTTGTGRRRHLRVPTSVAVTRLVRVQRGCATCSRRRTGPDRTAIAAPAAGSGLPRRGCPCSGNSSGGPLADRPRACHRRGVRIHGTRRSQRREGTHLQARDRAAVRSPPEWSLLRGAAANRPLKTDGALARPALTARSFGRHRSPRGQHPDEGRSVG